MPARHGRLGHAYGGRKVGYISLFRRARPSKMISRGVKWRESFTGPSTALRPRASGTPGRIAGGSRADRERIASGSRADRGRMAGGRNESGGAQLRRDSAPRAVRCEVPAQLAPAVSRRHQRGGISWRHQRAASLGDRGVDRVVGATGHPQISGQRHHRAVDGSEYVQVKAVEGADHRRVVPVGVCVQHHRPGRGG